MVYLYGDTLKQWRSDGWGLAPIGTAIVVIGALLLAFQLILVMRSLPDTRTGRWTEAVIAAGFAALTSHAVFGWLGLSTFDDPTDGFPDSPICVVGLTVGALVTLAIPTVAIVWRARRYPPVGTALPTPERVRLAMRSAATVLLIAIPVIAETTATEAVLYGLGLVVVIDYVSSWRRVVT
jgi:hypothetical protein